MSDWTPQIVRIEKVENLASSDNLDLAVVLTDYPVIVKRDEYKVGDWAAYLPIDTIVPDTEQFHFLCPKLYEKQPDGTQIQVGPKFPVGSVPEKYRIIKAKKIRGTYSQGMLTRIPTEKFFCGYDVGDSIVEAYGLKKWEEEEEENLPNVKKSRGTNAEKAPSGWAIPHYDIDSVRKYVECLLPNEEIVLTEKIHGSNAAFTHDGTRLWSKSRNYYKKMDPNDMWWDIALRYDLESKLAKIPGFVVFGEIYGQVKGFKYDCTMDSRIRFFDVWNLKTMRYLDYDDRVTLLRDLLGLDVVPELYRGPWLGKDEMYKFAEGLTTLGGRHIREGWVLNTVKERYEPKLDSRMQVKLVGESYNLSK